MVAALSLVLDALPLEAAGLLTLPGPADEVAMLLEAADEDDLLIVIFGLSRLGDGETDAELVRLEELLDNATRVVWLLVTGRACEAELTVELAELSVTVAGFMTEAAVLVLGVLGPLGLSGTLTEFVLDESLPEFLLVEIDAVLEVVLIVGVAGFAIS